MPKSFPTRRFPIAAIGLGLFYALFFALGSAQAFRITLIEEQPDGRYTFEFESNTNQYFMLESGNGAGSITNRVGIAMGTNGLDRVEDVPGIGLRNFFRMRRLNFDEPTDRDGDGLADAVESELLGTDPDNADSDFDQLSDGDEFSRGTNPLAIDSDADGFADVDEVALNTNPLDAGSKPTRRVHSAAIGYINEELAMVAQQARAYSPNVAFINQQLPTTPDPQWTVAAPISYLNESIEASTAPDFARSDMASYLNAAVRIGTAPELYESRITSYLNVQVSEQHSDLRAHSASTAYINAIVNETAATRKSYSPSVSYLNAAVVTTPHSRTVGADPISYLNAIILEALQKSGLSPIISYENGP